MLKNIFFIINLLLFSTVGLNIAYADETTAPVEQTLPSAENLPADSSLTPEKNVSSSNQEAKSAVSPANQTENSAQDNKVNQNQSTTPQVTQNQNVTGDPAAVQNQNADVSVCQQQTSSTNGLCKDNNGSNAKDSTAQGQSTGIQAVQEQTAASSAQADAEQNQETGIVSDQSQVVHVPVDGEKSQIQGTSVLTNQSQSAITNSQANILQGQLTEVFNTQNQLLNPSAMKQKQGTLINAIQFQNLIASDSAKIEQLQSADVKSNMSETAKKNKQAGVKVKTRNYLEIIKSASSNIVRFIQEIFVNDKQVDVYNHDYSITENNSYAAVENYHKQYEWGKLDIVNTALITFNDGLQNFEATLTGFLGLVFNGKMSCKSDNPDQNGGDGGNNPPGSGDSGGPSKGDTGGSKSEHPVPPKTVHSSKGPEIVPVTEIKTTPVQTNHAQNQVISNELPNTSTNNYNLLIFGFVLMIVGTGLFFTRNRLNVHNKK